MSPRAARAPCEYDAPMIQPTDLQTAAGWLRDRRRPLLLCHSRADGDALAALAGLTILARHLGAAPTTGLFDPFPQRYALLKSCAPFAEFSRAAVEGCDSLVIVDTCALAQLEPVRDYLAHAPPTLVLDHHATRDDIATRPGDLRLIDETASAASLLVAELAEAAGMPLTPDVATALFVGIASDTGWFRHSNTDARTLARAATLVAAGAAPAALYDALYHRDPLGRLRLAARALGSLELHARGRLAVMTLRAPDFVEAGADETMTDDLVNEAARLGGTEATLLFVERGDGTIRANFRSKTWLDVAQLAKQFGGGGHARAAGARPAGAWADAVPRVIAATVAALG